MSDHDNIPTTEAPLAANAKAYSLPSPEIHIDFNNYRKHSRKVFTWIQLLKQTIHFKKKQLFKPLNLIYILLVTLSNTMH
jgi:hypothetical protein